MKTLCGITAALVLCAACGGNDHPGVSLGTFAFTGQTRVGPRPVAPQNGPCKSDGPLIPWTTTLLWIDALGPGRDRRRRRLVRRGHRFDHAFVISGWRPQRQSERRERVEATGGAA